MNVIRNIHPVGQGGFYTETITTSSGKHTVVYDCGGSSKEFMEEYLDGYLHRDSLGKRMEIAAVFISHLHADHVNGLKYLLDHADVKLLVLPQLTDEMMLDAFVYNKCYSAAGGADVNRLVLRLYEEASGNGYHGDTRVVQVSPDDLEHRTNDETEEGGLSLTAPRSVGKVIPSGTHFHLDYQWMYIPYNPPVKDLKGDFSAALAAGLGATSPVTVKTLPELMKGKEKAELCKGIYEDHFGKNHNAYSMTLFSGTKRPERFREHYHHKRIHLNRCIDCYFHHREFLPNCLYTGDFEPKSYIDGLIRFYGPLWKTIRSVQVPHHGSRRNFDEKFYDYACLGFVSAGERNRHRHPNMDTLINICKKDCFPLVITEDKDSTAVFEFSD